MLKSLWPGLLLLIILSGFKKPGKPPRTKKQAQIQNLDIWEIPEADALKMIKEYDNCTGKTCYNEKTTAKEKRNNIKRSIYKYYRVNFFNHLHRVSKIKARYTPADEERYRAARHLASDDPSGMVAGYTTKIFRIKVGPPSDYVYQIRHSRYLAASLLLSLTAPPASFRYYDTRSICPPPVGCQ